MEEQLREDIKTIHDRLHGRQRTHQEVAKHSRWTSTELENVLREDEWLYEKEMLALLSQHTQRARVEGFEEAANKIFVDITTGHEITRMTTENAKHDPKCSSKQGFMCDCEIINAAQHAINKAKERVLAQLSTKEEA
ncbi:hypothetical protein [Streptomyces sp. NPDC056401]|uniref:hypothetical protein n=1 Tax=Streptomyces sp. NPDC056401 TaxID=3345809 RepID=UPI0035E337F5